MLSVGYNLESYLKVFYVSKGALARACGKSNPTLFLRSLKGACHTDTLFQVERATHIPLTLWLLPVAQFTQVLAHRMVPLVVGSPLYEAANERFQLGTDRLAPLPTVCDVGVVPSVFEASRYPEFEGLRELVDAAMAQHRKMLMAPFTERRGTDDVDGYGFPLPVAEALVTAYIAEPTAVTSICREYSHKVRNAADRHQPTPPVPWELATTKRTEELLISHPLTNQLVWNARYVQGTSQPPKQWSAESTPWLQVGIADGPVFGGSGGLQRRGPKTTPSGIRVQSDGTLTVDPDMLAVWQRQGRDPQEMVERVFGHLPVQDRGQLLASVAGPAPQPAPQPAPPSGTPSRWSSQYAQEPAPAPDGARSTPPQHTGEGHAQPFGARPFVAPTPRGPMQAPPAPAPQPTVDTAPKGEYSEGRTAVTPDEALSPLEADTGLRPLTPEQLQQRLRDLND